MTKFNLNAVAKRNSIKFLLILTALTLFFHGLALLNNSAFWDGRLIRGFQLTNNYHQLRVMFYSAGAPIGYFMHSLLWFLSGGGLFVYNISAVSSIGAVGYLLYLILKKYNFSERSARIAAVVAVVYPGCQLTTFSIITPEYLLVLLFFIGWYLSIASQSVAKYYLCVTFRLLSLLFFFISFGFNSLLCFFAVFILFEYYRFTVKRGGLFSFKNILSYMSINVDFIVLPIVFFAITKYYFPVYGLYKGYNHISLRDLIEFGYYRSFLWHVTYPLIVIPLCIVIIYYTVSFVENFIRSSGKLIRYQSLLKSLRNNHSHVHLMLFGAAALFFAIAPYIAVGKISPKVWSFAEGYVTETRFAFLVPLAIGIFMAGFVPMFVLKSKFKFYSLQMLGIISFLGASFLFWGNHYITMQGIGAIQKSFVYKLKHDNDLKNFSLYKINSNFSFVPYEFYTWSTLLNDAYGGHSRVGYLSLQPYLRIMRVRQGRSYELNPPFPSPRIRRMWGRQGQGAENYSSKGKHVSLDILTGRYGGGLLKIGILNLYYRFFDQAYQKYFLNNLIIIKYKLLTYKMDVK